MENFFGDLTENPHNIKNLSNLIDFLKATPEEEYNKLGADWFENARDAPASSDSEAWLSTKARMEYLGGDIVRLLDCNDCDLLLATSSMDLPLDLGRLPGISVPLGYYSKDRPVVIGSEGLTTKGPNIPYVTIEKRKKKEVLSPCS